MDLGGEQQQLGQTQALEVPRARARNLLRIRIGNVPVDAVRFSEALEEIEALVRGGGGAVFTPNVDHVVLCEERPALREAYGRVELSLPDGQPVVWASRALGFPLPEKVSGSDLLMPLMARAAQRKWRVFLLGGAAGVADEAREVLRQLHGVNVVGTASPSLPEAPGGPEREKIARAIALLQPDLVIVALGAPKQELWIDALKEELRPAVFLGLGASLDFLVGRVRRAPAWMSRAGLEWFYRLCTEPGRLWRRYLLRDPAFFGIVLRQWRNTAPLLRAGGR